MLGLAQQVGGHELGIGLAVSDDQHLGGSGHHVDVQLAVGLPLGGSHKSVAGAHQLIHPGNEARAIGQGGHRLGAAHGDHPVHSGNLGGGQHRVVQILGGGRHHDDLLHPRHLGGYRVHQHAAGIGCRAAGYVDAHPGQATDHPAHHAPVGGIPLHGADE